jgi:hypothetical protein
MSVSDLLTKIKVSNSLILSHFWPHFVIFLLYFFHIFDIVYQLFFKSTYTHVYAIRISSQLPMVFSKQKFKKKFIFIGLYQWHKHEGKLYFALNKMVFTNDCQTVRT